MLHALEMRNVHFARGHHLLRHVGDLAPSPIIYRSIREHQADVALKLFDVADAPVLNSRPQRLQIHRTLDDLVIIGRLVLMSAAIGQVRLTLRTGLAKTGPYLCC